MRMTDIYFILIPHTGVNCYTVSEHVQTYWQQNFIYSPNPVLHVGTKMLV
jgi:hypothetical protein